VIHPRRAHTRPARGVVVLLAAALVLAACSGRDGARGAAANSRSEVLGVQAARTPVVVTPDERTAFLEIALQSAAPSPGGDTVLSRWTTDPTITVTGAPTEADRHALADATIRWSLITGRRMTVVTEHAAVTVHFVPRARFASVLGVDQVDDTAVGLTRLTIAPAQRGRIVGAIVVIDSGDDQVLRNRTIAHELGHVMGLQHSSCASSLMDGASDPNRSVRWSPSALDVRMGQILYDPRLEPGLGPIGVDALLSPTALVGATCAPVDLELVRAAGSGHQYFCVRSLARVRPCTGDTTVEPTLPLVNPDAWTDGRSLGAGPPR